MKIVQQTQSELVTADSGLFLSTLFAVIGVPMLIAGALPGKHGLLFGAGFMLLFAAVYLRKTTFVFDRGRGRVFWRKRKLFKVFSGEIPFSDIADIGFDTMPSDKGTTMYRLTVITASSRVPTSDMYGGGRKYYETVRDEIVEFLAASGSPISTAPSNLASDESSLRSLILQGRKIDAIELLRSWEQIDLTEAKQRVDEMDRSLKVGK
ncbi:MAG TPA: hypothetical protein VFB43_05010 [Terracidiphilus sp.]|nr:hypothetical protein [Terracidiphilus sp.]